MAVKAERGVETGRKGEMPVARGGEMGVRSCTGTWVEGGGRLVTNLCRDIGCTFPLFQNSSVADTRGGSAAGDSDGREDTRASEAFDEAAEQDGWIIQQGSRVVKDDVGIEPCVGRGQR